MEAQSQDQVIWRNQLFSIHVQPLVLSIDATLAFLLIPSARPNSSLITSRALHPRFIKSFLLNLINLIYIDIYIYILPSPGMLMLSMMVEDEFQEC